MDTQMLLYEVKIILDMWQEEKVKNDLARMTLNFILRTLPVRVNLTTKDIKVDIISTKLS